jgi:hypothetical protein
METTKEFLREIRPLHFSPYPPTANACPRGLRDGHYFRSIFDQPLGLSTKPLILWRSLGERENRGSASSLPMSRDWIATLNCNGIFSFWQIRHALVGLALHA